MSCKFMRYSIMFQNIFVQSSGHMSQVGTLLDLRLDMLHVQWILGCMEYNPQQLFTPRPSQISLGTKISYQPCHKHQTTHSCSSCFFPTLSRLDITKCCQAEPSSSFRQPCSLLSCRGITLKRCWSSSGISGTSKWLSYQKQRWREGSLLQNKSGWF